jgi:SHS2 domain-containing protein
MPFIYRHDLTTADIAFQAQGKSTEELFTSAWQALIEVMIPDSNTIKKTISKEICLEHESLGLLLLEFLNEALFYKDAEGLFLLVEKIRIENSDDSVKLKARLKGETIDRKRHELGIDVKAVTLHGFQCKQIKEGFLATVVLDI